MASSDGGPVDEALQQTDKELCKMADKKLRSLTPQRSSWFSDRTKSSEWFKESFNEWKMADSEIAVYETLLNSMLAVVPAGQPARRKTLKEEFERKLLKRYNNARDRSPDCSGTAMNLEAPMPELEVAVAQEQDYKQALQAATEQIATLRHQLATKGEEADAAAAAFNAREHGHKEALQTASEQITTLRHQLAAKGKEADAAAAAFNAREHGHKEALQTASEQITTLRHQLAARAAKAEEADAAPQVAGLHGAQVPHDEQHGTSFDADLAHKLAGLQVTATIAGTEHAGIMTDKRGDQYFTQSGRASKMPGHMRDFFVKET